MMIHFMEGNFRVALILWIITVSLYTILPALASLGLGIGVHKRRFTPNTLAFTFDDGPDPKYTPQLLDLLKKYNIKASFFTLGSKVKLYPHLIHRMHLEGHLIGVHNYVHRSNWLRMPHTIRRELHQSADLIEKITGVRPMYYRPPWGLLNLFDFGLRKHFQIVLWSLMVGDWRSKGGSERIRENLLKNLKDGDIILLHDSGDTWGADVDAPSCMIEALEHVFQIILSKSYKCLRVDDMLQQGEVPSIITSQHRSNTKNHS